MENNEEIEIVDKRIKVKFSKLEILCYKDGMFNIEFAKNLINEVNGHKLDGHFLRSDQLICIDMDTDEQTQRLTLLHEVLHGLDYSAGTNLVEEQVEWYSEAMYEFIRNNKEFAKLLLDDEDFDIFKMPKIVKVGWRKYDFKVFEEDGIKDNSSSYTMNTDTNKSQMLVSRNTDKEIEKESVIKSLLVCFNEIQKMKLSQIDRDKLANIIRIFINENKELCKFIIEDDMEVRLQDFILNEYRCYSPREYAYIMTMTDISFVDIKRDEVGQLYYFIDEELDKELEWGTIKALQEYRQSRIDHSVITGQDIQVPLHQYMYNLETVKCDTRWFIENEIRELEESTGLSKKDYATSMPDIVVEDLKTHYEKGYEEDL